VFGIVGLGLNVEKIDRKMKSVVPRVVVCEMKKKKTKDKIEASICFKIIDRRKRVEIVENLRSSG